MKDHDLDNLTSLWQSTTPALKLDIQATQRRYRRHRWIMRFNIVIEILSLLFAAGISVWVLLNESDWLLSAWVLILTLWGWIIFFPVNLSRLRSFKLMKSNSLNDSMRDHIKLTEQEVYRWRLNLLGTFVLAGLLIVLLVAQILLRSEFETSELLLHGAIVASLMVLALWFYRRLQASKRLLKVLSE
ncbi:hypothetical protein AB8S08_05140 [Pseudidiomarina sp. PP-1MA]|uniref:Uncharacterized protein n=1 Tax=Pseudidiomarina sp. PP-1MA TaxID=3237706 RepID=A0AB39X937_9GAMM